VRSAPREVDADSYDDRPRSNIPAIELNNGRLTEQQTDGNRQLNKRKDKSDGGRNCIRRAEILHGFARAG